MSNNSGLVQPCITRSKSVQNEPHICPRRSQTAEWKKVSSLYLHSRWPGKDTRKLCGVYLQANQRDSHKWQRKRDKWQTWAFLTRRRLLRVREILLPDYVCELFLNRDLSHTVINHRATHKLRHLQPREPISGLLTLSSDDECTAPSDIFSFSDEIDQSSNPGEKKSLKAGLAGWSSSGRLRPAIHQALAATTRKGRAERNPFPFFLFFFFLTRRGWVNRDYESRREQSGQRDKSYLTSKLNLSSCYGAMARASWQY